MQKHIQWYPNCPFVGGQIAGVNLSPPNLDNDHPTIQLMKNVDKIIKKVSHCFCLVDDKTFSPLHVGSNDVKYDSLTSFTALLFQYFN